MLRTVPHQCAGGGTEQEIVETVAAVVPYDHKIGPLLLRDPLDDRSRVSVLEALFDARAPLPYLLRRSLQKLLSGRLLVT